MRNPPSAIIRERGIQHSEQRGGCEAGVGKSRRQNVPKVHRSEKESLRNAGGRN